MPSIRKRVVERLARAVAKFQKVLEIAKDRDVNESDTVAILVDMLAEVFGYDKYLEVTSEFAIRSTYCDLAVKVDDKVQFLVEAKAIGIDLKEGHLRQVIDYGANHGIQWVVLTNGIDWRVYRIRFEQPITYDLVCAFDFLRLDPGSERRQQELFLLCREGLSKNAREDFYEKVQSVNRFVIGSLILGGPVLGLLRRELKKLSEGVRIDLVEIEQIVRTEVLKRELVEGEEAEEAQARVNRFYKKSAPRRRKKAMPESRGASGEDGVSFSDRLLQESGDIPDATTQEDE